MSAREARNNDATIDASVKNVDLKLEVVVIPVSDVDRIYQGGRSRDIIADQDSVNDKDYRFREHAVPHRL